MNLTSTMVPVNQGSLNASHVYKSNLMFWRAWQFWAMSLKNIVFRFGVIEWQMSKVVGIGYFWHVIQVALTLIEGDYALILFNLQWHIQEKEHPHTQLLLGLDRPPELRIMRNGHWTYPQSSSSNSRSEMGKVFQAYGVSHDLFIPSLEVTQPLKGSVNHPKKVTIAELPGASLFIAQKTTTTPPPTFLFFHTPKPTSHLNSPASLLILHQGTWWGPKILLGSKRRVLTKRRPPTSYRFDGWNWNQEGGFLEFLGHWRKIVFFLFVFEKITCEVYVDTEKLFVSFETT